jgi:hypothetical protein
VTGGLGNAPQQQVRAAYDEHSIVVYRAYSQEIAERAVLLFEIRELISRLLPDTPRKDANG